MFKFWNKLTPVQKGILWFLNLPIFVVSCIVLYNATSFHQESRLACSLFICGMYSLFLIFITYNKVKFLFVDHLLR